MAANVPLQGQVVPPQGLVPPPQGQAMPPQGLVPPQGQVPPQAYVHIIGDAVVEEGISQSDTLRQILHWI